MFHRKLSCSFCGRSEDEVAKLVVGARAYICDTCVAIASDIMRESAEVVDDPSAPSEVVPQRLGD